MSKRGKGKVRKRKRERLDLSLANPIHCWQTRFTCPLQRKKFKIIQVKTNFIRILRRLAVSVSFIKMYIRLKFLYTAAIVEKYIQDPVQEIS